MLQVCNLQSGEETGGGEQWLGLPHAFKFHTIFFTVALANFEKINTIAPLQHNVFKVSEGSALQYHP